MPATVVPFTAPEGQVKGWKAVVPGPRPLATPAVVDGRVFLGGGFGSHEFYAFDAHTGALLWEYHTHDDGPTAAVAEDGLVAFNTESCELEVLTVEGRPVWKKWLGDPLMSMPAVAAGRVYMAYPDSKGDHQHHLACFDLRGGERHWARPIAGEIITAPVVAGGHVYLTTLEGTVSCFRASDGEPVWQEQKLATSAPAVWNGHCFFSRREETTLDREGRAVPQQTELLARRGRGAHAGTVTMETTKQHADYLDYEKRRARSPYEKAYAAYDGGVGFAFAKGDAKMEQARLHLGHGTVAGVWSYQGSKPFLSGDRLYSTMGDTLKCVDPGSEAVLWQRPLHPRGPDEPELLDSLVTPPALVNGKAVVGTGKGEVICLSADSGERLWAVNVGEPIVFQPAVAKGRVYVGTYTGSLVCLETGDEADDGWLMWGGSAGHNGRAG
jgi:Ca-activated chloride channel family protein